MSYLTYSRTVIGLIPTSETDYFCVEFLLFACKDSFGVANTIVLGFCHDPLCPIYPINSKESIMLFELPIILSGNSF